MTPDLIYDVGMHNGDDTAYYLHLGFRVVAIEADPTLVDSARARFSTAVAEERLILLNIGIAETAGEATFYVNPEKTVWNSFNREAAGRRGHELQEIRVPTRPFAAVLETHGVPHYLKIDIEGHDQMCLDALDAADLPETLSVESNSAEFVDLLAGLGYQAFKSIDQQSLCPLARPLLPQHRRYHRVLDHLRDYAFPSRAWIKLAGGREQLEAELDSIRSHHGWVFPDGASGSFGDRTPGEWQSADEVKANIGFYGDYYAKRAGKKYQYWYDLHAKRALT